MKFSLICSLSSQKYLLDSFMRIRLRGVKRLLFLPQYIEQQISIFNETNYQMKERKSIIYTKVSHLPFYRLFQMIVSCNLQINNSLTFCKRKLMLYINSLLQHLMVTKQVGLLQAHQQSVYLPSNSPWYQPH